MDLTAFLARVYMLYGTKRPVKLGPMLDLTPNAVRNWKKGKPPGAKTLLKILRDKGEDLSGLVRPSTTEDARRAPLAQDRSPEYHDPPELRRMLDRIRQIHGTAGWSRLVTAMKLVEDKYPDRADPSRKTAQRGRDEDAA